MEQKILFADEMYSQLTEYIKENQIHKAFIVCDDSWPYLRIKDYFAAIGEKAGITVSYFSDFKSNPRYESVVNGVEFFCRQEYDLIIAVGGGSAIDMAKCIKLFSNMDQSKNYLCQKIVPNNIKLLAIPTTAGTGSEATRFAVIYYEEEKQSITDKSCIPDAVMMDSSALKTLPLYQKKSTVMDALCHSIESFWSINSTDESKQYSKQAIKKILDNLELYLDGDDKAGSEMLYGANLAGKAINITQTTAGHAMCYKLTSLYGVAHGHGAALCVRKLWPYMIANIDKCVDQRGKKYLSEMFCELAAAMDCGSPMDAAKRFQDIFDDLELRIPEYSETDLEILTGSVNPVRLKNNPVALTGSSISELYRQILERKHPIL